MIDVKKEKEQYELIISKNSFEDKMTLELDDNLQIVLNRVVANSEVLELVKFIREEINPTIKIKVKGNFLFKGFTYKQFLSLDNCIFESDVLFNECIFKENVSFVNCVFKSRANFKKSIFEKKVRFHFSEFYEFAKFENTIFEDLADFYRVTFKNVQQFYLTDFLGVTIFSNATFENQVQFLYNKVSKDSIISFESVKFKEALDISRSNFWCKLAFWSCEINAKPTKLSLYQFDNIIAAKNLEYQEIDNSIALKKIRESYRIIKNEFRKEGNNIASLDFHCYEMIMLKNESEIDENYKFSDKIILKANWYSNKFGTDWVRAFWFTIFTTSFFYILFLICLSLEQNLVFDFSLNAIGVTLKHGIQFLNITNWKFEPFGISDYVWGYLTLFIGRIFIGYGYYQTIQSFRKFGKN